MSVLGSAGSRVVVAGTWTHPAGSGLPPVPAVATTVDDLGGALTRRCGLAQAGLRVIRDPADPAHIGAALTAAAEEATDALLFYFVGHGLVSRRGELYLATRQTVCSHNGLREETALPFSVVRDRLLESSARTKIVVLDCCLSGRAAPPLAVDGQTAGPADVRGAFVLVAAGRDEAALAPDDQRHTVFTGELIRLLEHGDPDGPEWLTLRAVHRHLVRTFVPRRLPEPRLASLGDPDLVALALNPAFRGDAGGRGTPVQREPLPSAACPYRGLEPFEAEHAGLFFGRRAVTAELVGRLVGHLTGGGPLVVVGASGSGKSSLLRAGLVPTLAGGALPGADSASWPRLLFTPGPDPVRSLAGRLAPVTGLDPERLRASILAERTGLARALDAAHGRRAVLIVDQFEETFALCEDGEQRTAFVEALCAAATGDAALVVLGLRADFVAECLAYPALAAAVQDHNVVVGPMSEAELREAIEAPAAVVGLALEGGLTDLLLRDAGGRHDAGTLPLLSHALAATWQRRHGRLLTVAGYHEAGGIAGAVATSAEAAYLGLTEEARVLARMVFLRAVAVGEDGQFTRRKVPRAELFDGRDAPTVDRVLGAFVATRLLTADRDTVTLAHEALLDAWPRLRGWLDEDRAAVRLRHQLTQDAAAWQQDGRDADRLYRGVRLDAAREFAAAPEHAGQLSRLELDFLDAATGAAERERERERRRGRLFRRLATGLAALLAVALVSGTIAAVQWRRAETSRDQALSRALAAESLTAAEGSPRRAAMLALRAWRSASTAEARGALLSADMLAYGGQVGGQGGYGIAISPDGRLIAIGGYAGRLEVWDAGTHERLDVDLSGHRASVHWLAFSPDGTMLATAASEPDGVRVWDMPSGRLRQTLPANGAIAWRPDGSALVTAAPGTDGGWHLVQWETGSWRRLWSIPIGSRLPGRVAYRPDGGQLAVGGGDGTVGVWRDDGAPVRDFAAHEPGTVAVAWSPDGGTLVTGGSTDGEVRFWYTDTWAPAGEAAMQGVNLDSVSSVAYTPDGRALLVVGGGPEVWVWLVDKRRWGPDYDGNTGSTVAIAVSADGYTVAAVALAGPTTIWRRDRRWLSWQNGAAVTVDFSRDGQAMAAGGATGSLQAWDAPTRGPRWAISHATSVNDIDHGRDDVVASGYFDGTVLVTSSEGKRLATLGVPRRMITGLALSPDGELLAAAASPLPGTDGHSELVLWSTRTWERRGAVDLGDTNLSGVAFTPDGSRLVTAVTTTTVAETSTDGYSQTAAIQLRRTADLGEERTIPAGSTQVTELAVAPDGETVAAVGTDNHVTLWQLHTGSQLRRFGAHAAVVRSVAFSPDGTTLATGSDDPIVRLWNAGSGELVAALTGHGGALNEVTFAPDGHTLASASTDGTVGVWDLDADRVVARLCQALAGPTLAGEWRAMGVDPADSPCR